jgi:hypothetical protein
MMAITIFMAELLRTWADRREHTRDVGLFRPLGAADPDGTAATRAGCWRPRYNPRDMPMIDLRQIDDLARRLGTLVPPALREGREEMQENFKAALQAGLAKLDLVTREEFDVQRAVLARTRGQLDELRALVDRLEAELAARDTPPPRD